MLKTSWFGRKNTSTRSNDFSLVRIIPLHQRGWHCPGIPEEIPWKKYRDRQLDVVSSGFWVYQNRMGCQALKKTWLPFYLSVEVWCLLYIYMFFIGGGSKSLNWGRWEDVQISLLPWLQGCKHRTLRGKYRVWRSFWDALVAYLPSISYKITGQHTACLFSPQFIQE